MKLIGICGPAGSGRRTAADHICALYPEYLRASHWEQNIHELLAGDYEGLVFPDVIDEVAARTIRENGGDIIHIMGRNTASDESAIKVAPCDYTLLNASGLILFLDNIAALAHIIKRKRTEV